MPTQMVSYHHLVILYAWSPLVSIFGPIIIGIYWCNTILSNLIFKFGFTLGFIGDKLGNYKAMAMFCVAVGGAAPFGILWLFKDHQNYLSLQNNTEFQNTTRNDHPESAELIVNQSYTFPLLVIFRLMCFFSATTSVSLLDASGLTMCKKYNCDFGRQKLWGNYTVGSFDTTNDDYY